MKFDYNIQSFDSNGPSAEFQIWRATRILGNYTQKRVEAANILKEFKKFCKTFSINYEVFSEESSIATAFSPYSYVSASNTSLTFYYNEARADIREYIENIEVQKKELYIKWWYHSQGSAMSTQMPLTGNTPHNAFYPWMTQSIESFAADFLKSTANVLLLIGPPGTGKTSFIRGICRNIKCETWVTYDPRVQDNEQFYINFASYKETVSDQYVFDDDEVLSAEDPGRCLVVEDADEMLSKRSEGNKVMNRLLNLSDGLISLPARKIIFSTNLPGINSIDEALLRPGRCFAAVKFRDLTYAEAKAAADAVGVELVSKKTKMTLSEALNGFKDNSNVIQKIGF